jgi:hypothetical protein
VNRLASFAVNALLAVTDGYRRTRDFLTARKAQPFR